MWGRRDVATEAERKQQLRCGSDISCGEEDVMPPSRSFSSRGVQVSAEYMGPMSPLRPALADSCPGDQDNTAHRSVADASARSNVDVRHGGSGGSGWITWRWRRFEQAFFDGARERSPGASSGYGSSSQSRPRKRSGSKGTNSTTSTNDSVTGSIVTASQAADPTTTAAVVMPQLVKCVRTRGSALLRDSMHQPVPDAAASVYPIATSDSATTSPELAPTTNDTSGASSLLSSHLLSLNNTKPERLVADLLLNNHFEGSARGEPASPATSGTSDTAPSWAERTGLAGGTAATSVAPVVSCSASSKENAAVVRLKGDRDVPRFLRPVLLLLMLSAVAIVWTRVGRGIGGFGPAVHAAGGVQVSEDVVDEIFERADKDKNGVIADEEIQYLVEGARGALLDDALEIKAGVASVIKHLDGNEDHALSRTDLLTYWKRLGTLLTVDEVAQWVVHAAQLPQNVADIFRSNTVTGYDFPELAANQGALLEQDLGITRPTHRKVLVRSMKWKLWGMGEEPAAPKELRVTNASCGVVHLEWDLGDSDCNLSFPVHKSVVQRALLGQEVEMVWGWETVMDGPERAFFDFTVRPGASYRYHLEVWNALGHSSPVETDIISATGDCVLPPSWWGWLWPGDLDGTIGAPIAAMFAAVAIAAALLPRKLIGVNGSTEGGVERAESSDRPRVRVEPLTASAVTSYAGVDANGSPMSASSGGGGAFSDREKRAATGASLSSLLKPVPHGSSKERLKRSGSEVVGGTSGGAGSGRLPASSSVGSSSGTRESFRAEASKAATVESIRREAVKRLMSKRTSSQDREVCRVCHKEWRWFQLKHTCGLCHRQFCDRRECGVTTHSFGACPVGGSCICSRCLPR